VEEWESWEWVSDRRLIYLKGYRDGSDEKRVELLKQAISTL
jgi:hypothetical protein